MATRKLSTLLLRRHYHHHSLRTIYSSISSPSSSFEPYQFTSRYSHPNGCGFLSLSKFSTPSSRYRSFSTDRGLDSSDPKLEHEDVQEPGFFDYDDSGIAQGVGLVVGSAGDEAILPVRCLIWFLDGLHDFTGLPWWLVIAVSTLTLRVAVLPLLLLQLNKLKRHAELAPQLPPPLPPPFSGESWIEHLKSFREKRKAINCPSFLWVLTYPSVQIPCFILGTATIRNMALNHHPGFEFGGIMWFQNLTELPHGVLGVTFPLLIAALHISNIQVSLKQSFVKSYPNVFGLLAKYYKFYLQALTIPIFFGSFYLPQGSLEYWATNSTISLIQQLTLQHPVVRKKLGFPDKLAPTDSSETSKVEANEVPKVRVQDLPLLDLFNLSIKFLSKEDYNKAIPLLRLALEKDPEYVRALIVMGQVMMKGEQLSEAVEHLEHAVSKLLLAGHPTDAEEIDHLILASLWAGVAYAKQGKVAEGIVHLERIANMKEPDDEKTKTHYIDGLFMLSSALASVGRNEEAAKYLRILTAYHPSYSQYLKDLESTGDNFAGELENSRRKDY